MKPLAEWTQKDIEQLISDRATETLTLEFKGPDALKKTDKCKREISKDVSAFANSVGGTILYGINESEEEPSCAESMSPVVPAEISTEWLDQVINSNIHRKINGVKIIPIPIKTDDSEGVVYAIQIPESTTAHQASDHKYYKRSNGRSAPMEDYEVRQTMIRASHPAYEATLEPFQIQTPPHRLNFRMESKIHNFSEIVGYDVSAILLLPIKLLSHPDEFEVEIDGNRYSRIPGGFFNPQTGKNTDRLETAQPLSPYVCQFSRDVGYSTDISYGVKAKLFLLIYDRHGLALKRKFLLTLAAGTPVIEPDEIMLTR